MMMNHDKSFLPTGVQTFFLRYMRASVFTKPSQAKNKLYLVLGVIARNNVTSAGFILMTQSLTQLLATYSLFAKVVGSLMYIIKIIKSII